MNENQQGTTGPMRGILTFALFMCPLVFLPVRQSYVVPRQTFLVIALTILLASAFTRGSLNIRKSPLFIPWIIFIVISFISIFSAPHFFMGWKAFCFFAVCATLCAAVPLFEFIRKNPSRIFLAILFPGFLNAFYCIFQFTGHDFEFFRQVRFDTFGTLGSPAMLAGYLAACGIISVHLFVKSESRFSLITGAAGLVIFPFAMIFTASRAAIISFIIGCAVFFLLVHFVKSDNRTRLIRKNIIAFLLIAVSITGGLRVFVNSSRGGEVRYASSVIDDFFEGRKEGSISQRKLIWSAAYLMISDHPVAGSGIGTFGYEYPLAQSRVLAHEKKRNAFSFVYGDRVAAYAHNDYIQIASETGFPGLAALLLFPLFAIADFIRSLKRKERFSIDYGPVSIAVAASMGIQSLFDFPLYMPASALICWLFLGMSAGIPEKGKINRYAVSPVMNIAVVALSIVFCMTAALPLVSSLLLSESARAISSGDMTNAIRMIDAAKIFDPSEPAVHGELARIAKYRNRYDEAVMFYEDALNVSNHPEYYYGKGSSEYMISDYSKAEEDFKTVLAIDPSTADAMGALGVIYFETEEYEKAGQMFMMLLDDRPGDPIAQRFLTRLRDGETTTGVPGNN